MACLVPYPVGRVPSQRFRLEQWTSPLEREGIRLEFLPLLGERAFDLLYTPGRTVGKALDLLRGCLSRTLWTLRLRDGFDAVVIHREATPFGIDWIERAVAARFPTVYDFDDAIWLPHVSEANRAFWALKGSSKVDRILARVDVVAAGCEHLAGHARPLNANVFVVPTSVDLDAYGPPRRHDRGDTLVVGWSGSVTTAAYLPLVAPALRRAAQRFPLRLIVYGARVEVPGVDVQCIPWSPETEVQVIRSFDVGLKPMPREEWVRGKCPMKELQYMALGVPPVATAFGTAPEAIRHGETGLLCSTEDEWVDALSALRDPPVRERMGVAGRRVVEERYSATASARVFARALREAVGAFAARHRSPIRA